MPEGTELARPANPPSPLFAKFGESFGVNPGQVTRLLAATVISVGKNEPAPTNEEIAACAIVCNTHNLNPFTKEIHCFRSKGKMLFAIGVDGWSKIAQRQPTMNGVEWEAHLDKDGHFYAMTCRIFRKDWSMPIVVTEYLDECRRDTEPWNKSPRRMMRNRSFSQAVRMAFAIGGLMDETEADQVTNGRFSAAIIEGEAAVDQTEIAIRQAALQLNMNDGRLNSLRQQYDDPAKLLDFLHAEQSKVEKKPTVMPPRTRPQRTTKPNPAQNNPEDESQESAGPEEPAGQGFDFEPDMSKMNASDSDGDF